MSQTANLCCKCDSCVAPHAGSGKAERLTRCRGLSFFKKFLEEGLVRDESGHEQPASFVVDCQERHESTVCNSAGGAQRYFHQSCYNRLQATALSYDTNLLSYCKKRRCYEQRNICHLLCDDCLAQLRADPDIVQGQLQIKMQNTGMSLSAASRVWQLMHL